MIIQKTVAHAPSRPNKSPESVTDFSRDIDTDWELVNGWRPPRSYQKSKIKLSGNDILIGNGVILSDRIFAANPRHGKSELMRELESTIMYRTDIIVIPSRKDDIAGQACNMVRFLNDRTVLFDESLSEGTLGEQLQNTIQYRGLHVLEFPSAPAEGNGAVGCYCLCYKHVTYVTQTLFRAFSQKRLPAILKRAGSQSCGFFPIRHLTCTLVFRQVCQI